jgi:hypothetical protein
MSIELLERAINAIVFNSDMSQESNAKIVMQLKDLIRREKADRDGKAYYAVDEEVIVRRISRVTGKVRTDEGVIEQVMRELSEHYVYDVRITKDNPEDPPNKKLDSILMLGQRVLTLKEFVE